MKRIVIRFLIVLLPSTILRFYLGDKEGINFLWFFVLYLPFINWSVYWIMFTTRVGINKLKGHDWITVPKLRQFYVWYINVPGSLIAAEIIYRGYVFNT